MKKVIDKFKKWKEDHPDEDYQYDEIHEFLSQFSRNDILEFIEEVERIYDLQQ